MGWHKPDNVAGSSAPAIMVGSFVATGGLLFGYDTGSINGILAMTTFKNDFTTGFRDAEGNPGMYPSQVSLIVAMLSAGTAVGALLAAPVGDKWGRRRSLIGAILIFCVGAIFQVCATNVATLVVGRTLAGVGVGMVSVLVPLYQSEMAPKWIRGTLVCAYQLSITLGLFGASLVNIFTYKMPTAAAYRIPMGLQLTWASVLALGLLVLPETPRYLIKQGLKDAAALSLSRLRRLDITHPALIEELAEIEANHDYEMAMGADSYHSVFFGEPHLGRRIVTGCGLQMLQQLTGVNFIMYYSTTFFNGANVNDPFSISLIMQVINVVSTLPGLFVVESLGRRRLLMSGAVGMAICQLFIASYATANGGNLMVQNQILIGFVAIYVFFFAASWGPVVWVVTSEIYPLKVRAKSMSISTSANWILNFGIAYGTPYLVGTTKGSPGSVDLGSRVFFVWGAFCLVAVAFVYFMVYETSKISLEQIDEMYERVDYAWNSRSFEPSWSFQQMRDFGFSDSGVPPAVPHLELQSSRTSSAGTSHTDTGVSSTTTSTSSQDDKIVASLGHVDLSY
ncbi:general substrate transporter [Lasiosphaeria miniovina]|uniref:General substrate transporter n=1 Tax=Lasiosphaeria miniovina TaxID=1954250 RepID=A0AA40BIV6_9PEZI|nr:general substrate transporter [Lasiosphaeria miniovina]KAK0735028.1 general substrate transporter [Lasiosphaeria miniovina]